MPTPVSRKSVQLPRKVFYGSDGKPIVPMPVDYGYRSGAGRLYEEHYGEVPSSVWHLATESMARDLAQLRTSYRFPQPVGARGFAQIWRVVTHPVLHALDKGLERLGVLDILEENPMAPAQQEQFEQIRTRLALLRLSGADVAREECRRVALEGQLHSPAWVKQPFLALSWALDRMYADRPIQKFWVLETVARIPYFAFISTLHLYESLGLWRAGAELRKVHFAEEWNGMHHLQIMESLGGDQAWIDRFLAEHAACLCFPFLVVLYMLAPKIAYNLAQRVENHARDTYTVFVETNKELLASLPPPQVALTYYHSADLYLFDEFQAGNKGSVQRRPQCSTLLDVFVNVRDDEDQHVRTLVACQDESIAHDLERARRRRQK